MSRNTMFRSWAFAFAVGLPFLHGILSAEDLQTPAVTRSERVAVAPKHEPIRARFTATISAG
ncbi:MAG: hypothetical protein KatS3mg130_1829 [Candidatus Sumerlaea sp.]|nr:MAG: hypothetical protein KatS3mg130_1829 [Candidatus Sumerlaea sp.]